MALDTYDGLLAAIADTLNRDDISGAIPDFVKMMTAEAGSKLRVRQMVCRSTATVQDEFVQLPENYCGVKALSVLTSPPTPLRFVDAAALRDLKACDDSPGTPHSYTLYGSPGASLAGGELQLYPAPGSPVTIEFLVYEVPADLATYGTNWLLTRYPHVCLYGACKQAAPYLKDDARLALWSQLFEDGLQAIRRADLTESLGHRPQQRIRRFG